jgi:hypothetical protein
LDADTKLIRIKAIRSGRVIYINFFEQFTQLRIKRWTLCVCKSAFVHKEGKSTEERDAERQKHRQRQSQRDKGGRGRGGRREGERERGSDEEKGWGLREYLH